MYRKMNLNVQHSLKQFGPQAVILMALTVSTIFVYRNIGTCEFVNYDDPVYVSQNPHIQNGFSFGSITWAFTTRYFSNWHPVTWLSYLLDFQMFRLWAGGYHLVNLFIHICNVLLLYLLFRAATGYQYRSAVLAAFFALHPLHVESVAWISERKDVLCAFFWLLAMLAYYRYARRPSVVRYLIVFMCFILGSLSKSMMVTFPFTLLLFDYWPLNRHSPTDEPTAVHFPKKSWKWLVMEKIPMIAVSIIISLVAIWTQSKSMVDIQNLPVLMRIANALMAYIVYVKKMIWPGDLCVMYPLEMPPLWQSVAGFVFIAGALALAFALRRRHGYLLFGLLWYLGTLVPVIGIIQVGSQAMADRYTYIPSIGIFTALIWGVSTAFSRLSTDRVFNYTILSLVTTTVLILMMMLSSQQVRYWKNSITLMGNAVRVTENNYVAHQDLGLALVDKGLYEEAVSHFKQAIAINPVYAEAYLNIGSYYMLHKDYKNAIKSYQKAISLNAGMVKAYTLLGRAFKASGKPVEGEIYFKKAKQMKAADSGM